MEPNIYCDLDRPESIYAIASILTSLINGGDKKNSLREAIESGTYYEEFDEYYEDQDFDEEDPEKTGSEEQKHFFYCYSSGLKQLLKNPPTRPAFLLNIGPKNKKEAELLAEFAYRYGHRIILWLDNHQWPKKFLAFAQKCLRDHGHDLEIYSEASCLPKMEKLGYLILPRWLVEAEQMALKRMKAAVLYYYRAYRVCKVGDQIDPQAYLVTKFFIHAGISVCLDSPDKFIDDNYMAYTHMKATSKRAAEKIRHKSLVFQNSPRDPKIAYVNLGRIGRFLDFQVLTREARRKYPYLYIIQYLYNKRSYTKICSKAFDPELVLKVLGKDQLKFIRENNAKGLKLIWENLKFVSPPRSRNERGCFTEPLKRPVRI